MKVEIRRSHVRYGWMPEAETLNGPNESSSSGSPVWMPLPHPHTHLTALCPGLPGCAGTRKATPIWILLKQETVSGSGISWAICKSAPSSRQITTPAPHHSVFYRPDALPAAQPTASKHWRHKTLTVDVDASTTLSPNEVRNRTEFQPFSAELSVILGPGFAILHGNLTLTLSPILTWDSLTVQRHRHRTTRYYNSFVLEKGTSNSCCCWKYCKKSKI